MEKLPDSPTQPLLEYEGSVYVRGGNLVPRTSTEEDARVIMGFEAIDAHVEQLFEAWESDGDINAALDVCAIIAQFPEHYPPIPQALYDTLYTDVVTHLQEPTNEPTNARDLVIRCRQIPQLYAALTSHVLERLRSPLPLRNDGSHHLVSGYLDAYSMEELDYLDRYQALYHLASTCKSDDSAL